MSDQRKNFFNLHDERRGIPRTLAEGVTTRVFPGEHAMLSVVTLAPGSKGKLHHHAEEQWGMMLEGKALRIQGDSQILVQKGDFWRTPPNVPHTIVAGPEGALVLDVFSPPREDYTKPGSGFGSAGT